MKQAAFTRDMFSQHIPKWQQYLLCLRDKPVHCLEVGSYEGRSALWMVENICTHPDSTMTCVDTFCIPPVARRFEENTRGIEKILPKKGLSGDVLKTLPVDHYSFIYIDGGHEGMNVMEDAVLAFPLLKLGGLLCFDDYEHWPGGNHIYWPNDAIDPFLMLWSAQLEVLDKGYQVWARRK